MKRFRLPAATALAFSSTAYAAAPQPVTSSAGELFTVLFGLVAVIGLMAGMLWLLKRTGLAKTAGGGVVKMVGGITVGNRERVLVLEIADQWIVVGVAQGRISSLATLPRQEQQAPANNPGVPDANLFANWLKQKIEKRNAKN